MRIRLNWEWMCLASLKADISDEKRDDKNKTLFFLFDLRPETWLMNDITEIRVSKTLHATRNSCKLISLTKSTFTRSIFIHNFRSETVFLIFGIGRSKAIHSMMLCSLFWKQKNSGPQNQNLFNYIFECGFYSNDKTWQISVNCVWFVFISNCQFSYLLHFELMRLFVMLTLIEYVIDQESGCQLKIFRINGIVIYWTWHASYWPERLWLKVIQQWHGIMPPTVRKHIQAIARIDRLIVSSNKVSS